MNILVFVNVVIDEFGRREVVLALLGAQLTLVGGTGLNGESARNEKCGG